MSRTLKIDKKQFYQELKDFCLSRYGVRFMDANPREKYMALAETVMLFIGENWVKTTERNRKKRKAYYFSAEFLMGRSLGNNLLNLGFIDDIHALFDELGIDINELEEQEEDAALGNGGLGRLAACYMESGATEDLPLEGYGVRYEQGLFKQKFHKGYQVEMGDDWTRYGDPWSIRREDEKQIVTFRDQQVVAIPYDMPVIGYDNGTVNTLRLWQAEAMEGGFDFAKFNNYEYDAAVSAKNRAEDITRVLYPNDNQHAGKVLRLKQQYFFVSASIQDLIAKYKTIHDDPSFKDFAKYHVFQLNDTHPVIAIPELMRLFMDDNHLSWEDAWAITDKVFAFTNHTILQEAMERWSSAIMKEVSPRCYEIIKEIDRRHQIKLANMGVGEGRRARMRIVHDQQVEMAFLALATATHVNGVAPLHSQILKDDTLNEWYEIYPDKFGNVTNGVTPRRWLYYSNPELTDFITETLGSKAWQKDMSLLKGLLDYIEDDAVLNRLNEIKYNNKVKLADHIHEVEGIQIDPNSIYDIQVKRLHEYKRQLLNALHIVYLYQKLKQNPDYDMVPRTFIFGAKAAPGYFMAKAIIKFINEIARLVNNDPVCKGKMKVVFVQNFRVSYAEKIYPAADVSQQISTAGKEASGTGNMKFMMNGCPTLGTWDGANVEIFGVAGVENNFLFGARVEELREIAHSYNPNDYYMTDPDLKAAVDMLMSDQISDDGNYMFLTIYNALVNPQGGKKADEYFVLKDFDAYRKAQEEVDKAYRDRRAWAQKCLVNIATSGHFCSDRSVQDYNRNIWHIS